MIKNSVLFIVCISVFYSCKSQNKKINGLSFVSSRDSINTIHIQPVKKVSANYVALMPFGFIKNLDAPKVIYNRKRQWFGETNGGLKQYAREFKRAEIKFMVKPQIWIGHGVFTGNVIMNTEEDWKLLENSYEKFILNYAQAAEELEAPIFCIGTELEKFVKNRPTYWKNLIEKIRKVYSGKLTYAANWDEFKRVSFWGDLDFIGVDAYFPLSDKKTPTVSDFENGWELHKNQIEVIQKKYNKPVLFTEFGYRSVDFTGKEPWDASRISGNVNMEAQSNATKAIYNQFWKEDWFAGGFLWKWFHNYTEVGGENNNRFTPQNKPAEKLIKQLYER